jgi:two-component system cell cycle sensor histidine kinase/response regulator CckA
MTPATILIVEDNPITRKMLRVTLESEGHRVLEAPDGRTALEMMSRQIPTLIFQDLLLPDMSGLDLVRSLRQLPGGRETPIIAFSGLLSKIEEARTTHAGFTDYLFKPVAPSRLVEMVEEYLPLARPAAIQPGEPRRILLVDDDPVQRKLNTIQLTELGFQVTSAGDGAEALEQARRSPPDAILCDVVMPGMNGLDFCVALRQDPKLVHIPVVLTSSNLYISETDRQMAKRVGATTVVHRTPHLTESVQALLASRHEQPPQPAKGIESLKQEYSDTLLRQLKYQADRYARLSRRAARETAQLAVIAAVAEVLTKKIDPATAIDEALAATLDAAGLSVGAIYLTELNGRLRLQSYLGFPDSMTAQLADCFGQVALLQQIVQEGTPMVLTSSMVAEEDAMTLLARVQAKSLVIIPLLAHGEEQGALVMASDRREIEEGLLASAKAVGTQLAQAIALTRALTQFHQAQKMEAMGQLAGGIAHDFNNLLTVINGYSELTLLTMPADDPLRAHLMQINTAGNRAALLTRQILAFSRRQVIAPRMVDLNEVVANMDNLLRRLIGEDVPLVTKLKPGLGRINGDPGQIEQILMNLIVNARDAMPSGGTLIIETADVKLDEKVTGPRWELEPGSYVVLSVSDTGCGMDGPTQGRIFEPFFTTKEPGKGTGLGLSTVYGIVKQHQGTITVHSEVGQGTTFKVYLRRVDDLARPPETVADEVAAPTGTETVLLVEDSELVRDLARTMLETHGYSVVVAPNAVEALRLADRHQGPIHLLVTDVVMPGMNGRQLAEQVTVRRPEIKVLYMSGYSEGVLTHHGIVDQNLTLLPKPFTTTSLLQKIREVLSRESSGAHKK